MPDFLKLPIRTLAQLIAGGGLTALIDTLSRGLGPLAVVLVGLVATWAVSIAQNYLEAKTGKDLLPKPAPQPATIASPPQPT